VRLVFVVILQVLLYLGVNSDIFLGFIHRYGGIRSFTNHLFLLQYPLYKVQNESNNDEDPKYNKER